MGKTWVEFIQKESKNYKPIIK